MRGMAATFERVQLIAHVQGVEVAVDGLRTIHLVEHHFANLAFNARKRVSVVERHDLVGGAVEGDHRDATAVQFMQVVQSAPHVGHSLDFHLIPVLIARSVQSSALLHQLVFGNVWRTVVVRHESRSQGRDRSCAGSRKENVVRIDPIFLGMRHKVSKGGMCILNRLITTLLYRTLGNGEPHSVVDGSHCIPALREMLAPSPHVAFTLVAKEKRAAVQ